MPRQDGTGPDGNGPATGRGLGNCKPTIGSPNQQPNQPCGRGRGLKPCGGAVKKTARGCQGQGQGRGRKQGRP